MQFSVTRDLFDEFFNARTGYRAHFRAHYECGLKFNAAIIGALRLELERKLPMVVQGRELDCTFQDCGPARISRDFLISSLVEDLSKIWFCGKLIQREGGIRDLPTGVVGPKILLSGGERWAAPNRDERDAWLDVKGAFLGAAGRYQPKDPVARAKALQTTGQA